MDLYESSEDYLEAMLMLKEKNGYIRSIDIAQMLEVTKPSVTYATKRLRENGYITMDKDGQIMLTEKGFSVASEIYGRHKTLTDFFVRLGVPREIAVKDACKIEHDLSPETYGAIVAHAEELK